jgi:hypothetical protein
MLRYSFWQIYLQVAKHQEPLPVGKFGKLTPEVFEKLIGNECVICEYWTGQFQQIFDKSQLDELTSADFIEFIWWS